MARRLSQASRRRLRARREASLIKDGFTPAEAEYYIGFNWPITKNPIRRLQSQRKSEIKRLRNRGFSERDVEIFFERQWLRTNQAVLADMLVAELYQKRTRTRRARAA